MDAVAQAVLVEWAARETKHDAYCQNLVDYRKKKNAERAMLRESLATLTQTKDRLVAKRRGILPWFEVAKALGEPRRLAEGQRRALRQKLKEHAELVQAMHRWVMSMYQKLPLPTAFSWRSVTLLTSPESRQLGKEWITKQMLHNMERMFQEYQFPSMTSPAYVYDDEIVFDSDVSHAGYTFISRRHVEYDGSVVRFEQVVPYIEATFLALQCNIAKYSDATPKILHDTHDTIKQCAFVTAGNEYVNVIWTSVRSADRYVFVVQQIQDDEIIPSHVQVRQRNRMIWGEVCRNASGGCKTRGLALVSQIFSPSEGPVSLDDDAKEWGFDLTTCPEHLKEIRFPQLWKAEIERQHKEKKK
ncbi:Aste57867_23760 [Aphanomyces stellatus]|uniref:Aste57867_23760 protein n=1 Tax=Aphanomyces stellatus TaxID=120398 RepID=A0A485LNM4_9STRA|nr:hypothetical protein As57867_023688 [Aphanomyces stellatus]VFU00405.1 Aste57867_23760 [Aphanomyces stellatus]